MARLASRSGMAQVLASIAMSSSDPSEMLQVAASKGDLATLRTLLSYNYNVNSIHPKEHTTALYRAAEGGHVAAVLLLLEHSAEVNTTSTKNEATALHAAAKHGHTEIVRTLLGHHANVNARSSNRNSALHWAVAGNHMETVQVLLEFGADKGARNRYHKLPTALNQSTHMARLLQEHRWQWRIGLPTPPRFTAMILTLLLIRRFVEDSMLAAIPNELLFVLLEFMPLTPYFERDRSS